MSKEAAPPSRSRIATFFAERRWARIALFALVGLPPILGVTIGPIALMTRFNSAIKRSDAFVDSLEAARASEKLRAAIGEPIEDDYWTESQMLQQDPDAEPYMEVRYDVSGPEGTARIDYDARKEGEGWTLERAVARLPERGTTIVLWPTESAGGADAPDDEGEGEPSADEASEEPAPESDQPAK